MVKLKKEITEDQKKLAELYISLFENCKSQQIRNIEFTELKRKRIEAELSFEEDNEPWKIFKFQHKAWENKIDKLKQEDENAWNEFFEECKELESIMNLGHI